MNEYKFPRERDEARQLAQFVRVHAPGDGTKAKSIPVTRYSADIIARALVEWAES